MRGKVKIGEKDVEMLANAASPILFKRTFRQDWFKTLTESQQDETGIDGISVFEQMGFIMAMQAEKSTESLCNLSYSDYINWVAQFESEDLLGAVGEIAGIYKGQEETSTEPKKGDG